MTIFMSFLVCAIAEEGFFFEKKKQKTFALLLQRLSHTGGIRAARTE